MRNQFSWPLPVGGSAVTSIRQIAPFLNSIGFRKPEQPRRQLADARLVADDRDLLPPMRLLRQLVDDRVVRAAGRQRRRVDDRRRLAKRRRQRFGRLPRAHQRAGQNDVEGHVQRDQRLPFALQPLDAAARQRALRVVGISSRRARPPGRAESDTTRTVRFPSGSFRRRGRVRAAGCGDARLAEMPGRQRRARARAALLDALEQRVAVLDEVGVQPPASRSSVSA